MEKIIQSGGDSLIGETDKFSVYQIRWPVLEEVVPRQENGTQSWPGLTTSGQIYGEGLLLQPKGVEARGFVVALPDADQDPEQLAGMSTGITSESQFARRLAENGFTVVVPVVIDRSNRWSRGMNSPSRSWIYLQAFEMGRTVIGYEVQKVQALIDWFELQAGPDAKIGVAGYGEGGLVAFYSAALDTRIDAALVSGYFGPREEIWREPIHRNVWGLLREFGDAEIASLIAPRSLVVEYSEVPNYTGPPSDGKQIEGQGQLETPSFAQVESEFNRTGTLAGDLGERYLISQGGGGPVAFGSEQAVNQFMQQLGFSSPTSLSQNLPNDTRTGFNASDRMGRQVQQMEGHTQLLLRDSEFVRREFMQSFASQEEKVEYFWNEVIGKIDDDFLSMRPRTRMKYNEAEYTAYDVVLDVFPDIKAWGILCVPRGIQSGEKRPVVVCQHGLNGVPSSTTEPSSTYEQFAVKLAQRGFITFAPFNLYKGGDGYGQHNDRFRMIQRKANAVKASLFSIITPQHQQIINWLKTLPMVDPERIGFYGLSYGGKTAMRVPALVPEYCLSICSGDFNEWVRKIATTYSNYSYMFTHEWELSEWNMGHTFNYAEMAHMIYPRPFMVERGHQDGVAPDEWVAYEYNKVNNYYESMGQGNLTEIEFFDGPHKINGVGTFTFLHRHMDWPEP
jgi:dienelactone hydrolase